MHILEIVRSASLHKGKGPLDPPRVAKHQKGQVWWEEDLDLWLVQQEVAIVLAGEKAMTDANRPSIGCPYRVRAVSLAIFVYSVLLASHCCTIFIFQPVCLLWSQHYLLFCFPWGIYLSLKETYIETIWQIIGYSNNIFYTFWISKTERIDYWFIDCGIFTIFVVLFWAVLSFLSLHHC